MKTPNTKTAECKHNLVKSYLHPDRDSFPTLDALPRPSWSIVPTAGKTVFGDGDTLSWKHAEPELQGPAGYPGGPFANMIRIEGFFEYIQIRICHSGSTLIENR